ncbi:MAG TPA: LCP family protein [Gaiellaceae bacterium]|nr:LCP family protein [Gaiellaceae bacterium]
MSSAEKPYRLYRGGRVKGKVPQLPKLPEPGDGGGRRRINLRPSWRWLRWIPVGIALVIVFAIVWGTASYFQFRDGVSAANKRLGTNVRQVLDDQHGSASDILILGTDHAQLAGRESAHRTDSITLLRIDSDKHRFAYLSIPRDLRIEIPGHGVSKVNSAMQLGGPPLAVQTIKQLTDLPVNHIVVVDFSQFQDLIDKLGGIDIDVPERIVSKFDCPYPTEERCARWDGWRFAKGKQHMDGRRALIYARVRENKLNPADTDFSRAEHNQQVLQAVIGKLSSFGTVFKLPFIGDDLLAPVATDLGTHGFISLGWTKFRSSSGNTLHCRLGGEPSGGEIIPQEENRSVIAMVTGDSAAQPPVPGSGAFGPGCVTGNRSLGVR